MSFRVLVQTVCLLCILAVPAFAQNTSNSNFFITSDKVKLHYFEAGQGQAILLIPGWLMPADVWEPQFKELSKSYHVIALDPRSQGLSDMTEVGNNPLRRSQDIHELLDYLHLDSVVLVGWSLGAFDTLAYLDQFGTDKLYALVLVDSPLAAPSGPASAQRGPFLQRLINDREKANSSYVWSLFKKEQPLEFYKKLNSLVARIPTDIALATLDNTQPGENWQPSLKTLCEIPLLYAITPKFAKQAAYLQQVDPQARVETFDNSGHALFVDEPEHFNATLRDFLRQAAFYSAGMPRIASSPRTVALPVRATPFLSAPTPLPTSIPLAPFTPTPVPEIIVPSPSPTNPATPTETNGVTSIPSPSPTTTLSPIPSLTPIMTQTPIATQVESPILAPTSLSLRSRLSQKWNSIFGRKTKFTQIATISPTPQQQRSEQNESFENSIQDGFFTTSDHVKLHYLESGQGQAIVFIPGWILPAEIWEAQLEGLSPYYHVIALDPRSQGESDITPQGDEPLRQAKDIQELLDHLHLSSVVLVGWSHGGFQVLAYMGEFGTDRLYATVLVDSSLAAASSPVTTGTQSRFLDQFKNDHDKAVRGFVWSLFKTPPPADFTHALVEAALRTPTDIALTLLNSPFPGDSWQPSQKVMCQVPLLYAVNPKYTSQASYLTQVDPQARVEIFQNSGHALFFDESERFNNLIRDFLQKSSLYPAGLPEPHRKAGLPRPAIVSPDLATATVTSHP